MQGADPSSLCTPVCLACNCLASSRSFFTSAVCCCTCSRSYSVGRDMIHETRRGSGTAISWPAQNMKSKVCAVLREQQNGTESHRVEQTNCKMELHILAQLSISTPASAGHWLTMARSLALSSNTRQQVNFIWRS
ncbi:hypothetical protein IG631_24117 [Alternaria alternata]|nr:hypothetical protein IG631_24117 [Alternaria alternata]